MGGQYAPPPSPVLPIKELLRRAAFELHEADGVVTAKRPRRVPDRGLLRMLIPRVVVRVRGRGAAETTTIRPDGIAWMMLVVFVGGVIVEWTMDRATYPRDYPPAFVYGLSFVYIALFIAEVVMTGRAVRRALAGVAHG